MQRQHYQQQHQQRQQRQRPARQLGAQPWLTGLGVVAIALILGTAHLLDGPDDLQAEWQQADDLVQLQASATVQMRKERAGQAACEDLRGYNTTASFDADGALHCAAGRTVVKALL